MSETRIGVSGRLESPFAAEDDTTSAESIPADWLGTGDGQEAGESPFGGGAGEFPASMEEWLASEMGPPRSEGPPPPGEHQAQDEFESESPSTSTSESESESESESSAFEDELLDELVALDHQQAVEGERPDHERADVAAFEDAAPSESFAGPEHRDIGDRASGGQLTTIFYGEPGKRLTFGELVAMAGDYFGTYEEMAELSRTRAGRAELAWARWQALDLSKVRPELTPPPASDAIKAAVGQRYLRLAGQNLSHFSAGGSAWSAYVAWHAKALVDALGAGEKGDDGVWRRAVTKEAFGHHFLTDMFSAGHVRTPRASIREWYTRNHPDSSERFLRYMAKFMYDRLDERQQLPPLAWWFSWVTKSVIEGRIATLGGEAVKTFSLGDIVSLALHDMDNRGLGVVSDLDHHGQRVPGGCRWTAVGDSHLGNAAARPAATTAMAVAAVRMSLRDLQVVRDTGRKLAGTPRPDRAPAIRGSVATPFAARGFVPREDHTATGNVALPGGAGTGASPLEWRWGQLGEVAHKEVDRTVRRRIADELFDRLGEVPDPVVTSTLGFTIRVRGTRAAYRAFVDHLRGEGIRALELAVGQPARRSR